MPIKPRAISNEIFKNYKSFDIAWKGSEREIVSNEFAFSVIGCLLKDIAAIHSENTAYQFLANKFISSKNSELQEQYQAATAFAQWKEVLDKKYIL